MASTHEFINFIVSQIEHAGSITYRKMFGDYAIYCDGKVVALVCDDQLFVKETVAGIALVEHVVKAPPYPGASTRWLLIADRIEDHRWLSNVIAVTAKELPPPKPKKSR